MTSIPVINRLCEQLFTDWYSQRRTYYTLPH